MYEWKFLIFLKQLNFNVFFILQWLSRSWGKLFVILRNIWLAALNDSFSIIFMIYIISFDTLIWNLIKQF